MSTRAYMLEAIQKLIYEERENTVLSHGKTWLEENENRYFSSPKDNKFQIWRFTRGAQGFHPVMIGEVITNKQGETTIQMRLNLNPLGVLLAIVGIPGVVCLLCLLYQEV